MKVYENHSNIKNDKKNYEKPTLKVEVSFNTRTWGDPATDPPSESDICANL